jgi:hypothetical protein
MKICTFRQAGKVLARIAQSCENSSLSRLIELSALSGDLRGCLAWLQMSDNYHVSARLAKKMRVWS